MKPFHHAKPSAVTFLVTDNGHISLRLVSSGFVCLFSPFGPLSPVAMTNLIMHTFVAFRPDYYASRALCTPALTDCPTAQHCTKPIDSLLLPLPSSSLRWPAKSIGLRIEWTYYNPHRIQQKGSAAIPLYKGTAAVHVDIHQRQRDMIINGQRGQEREGADWM